MNERSRSRVESLRNVKAGTGAELARFEAPCAGWVYLFAHAPKAAALELVESAKGKVQAMTRLKVEAGTSAEFSWPCEEGSLYIVRVGSSVAGLGLVLEVEAL